MGSCGPTPQLPFYRRFRHLGDVVRRDVVYTIITE